MKNSPFDSLDPIQRIRAVSARLRNPQSPAPISHVFTLLLSIDSETLLSHAC